MTTKLIPPDGGWGWLIVIAYSVNMICTIPIMQGFGLLFRGICADLNMTGTDISVIISVNTAFGMGLGLINGPLLRYFGYRKVAIAGALCFTTGLTLSAWASSFAYLIITYGMLCSLGTGTMNSAFSLALNSYFLKRRGRAVGLAMTMNGLGPILAPQLMSFLISHYGARGTIMILGAISLHAFVGALTLQPIAWHQKEVSVESDPEVASRFPENADQVIGRQFISTSTENLDPVKRKRTLTMSSIDHDVDTGSIYGFETLVPRKKSTSHASGVTASGKTYIRSSSQYDAVQPPATPTELQGPAYKWWSSGKSLDTINLGSSMKIFDESRVHRSSKSRENFGDGIRDDERRPGEAQALMQKSMVQTVEEEEDGTEEDGGHNNPEKAEEKKKKEKKKSALCRAFHSIVVFFDFDLLRDPVYVNIMLGMSIAIFAELNFAILTPFILGEMSLDTEQIATVMSCLAVTDLLSRGFAPFVGEWLNQTARMMYLISLVLLAITRSGLLFAESYTSIILVGFSLGVAKGIRSVYMTLVISNYVPLEKLASASGIQMITNGFMFLSVGPILGVIKDKSGSYNWCIIFINGVTVLAVVMWTLEMIVRRIMVKPSKSIEENGRVQSRKTYHTSNK